MIQEEGSLRVNTPKKELQRQIRARQSAGDDDDRPHAAPGNFYFLSAAERWRCVNAAQGEDGHAQCPQAMPTDARLVSGYDQRVP